MSFLRMSLRGRSLSNWIAKNPMTSHLIAIPVGSICFVIIMFFNQWNLTLVIASDIMIFMAGVSGTVIWFLSGLGITLAYAALCSTMQRGVYKSPA